MRRRLSRAYDPNETFVVRIGITVHHEQNNDRPDHADRVPSLLPVLKAVRHQHVKRIVENELGQFERDAMLCKIATGLVGVPVKSHGSPTRMYGNVRTESLSVKR